jgi:hypothetical protein
MFTLATTACVLRGPRFCAQGEEQVEGGSAVCVHPSHPFPKAYLLRSCRGLFLYDQVTVVVATACQPSFVWS